jgi:hypothetical protein
VDRGDKGRCPKKHIQEYADSPAARRAESGMQGREGAEEGAKRREVPIEMLKGGGAVVPKMCVWDCGAPYHKNNAKMIQMRGKSPDMRAVVHEGMEGGWEEEADCHRKEEDE